MLKALLKADINPRWFPRGSLSTQIATVDQERQLRFWCRAGIVTLLLLIASMFAALFLPMTTLVIVVANVMPLPAAICVFRYLSLYGNRQRREQEIAERERLNPESWIDFLNTVIRVFAADSDLLAISDRLLTDDEVDTVADWLEGETGPLREDAQDFLDEIEVEFSDYVNFCRRKEKQPWNQPVPDEWFVAV